MFSPRPRRAAILAVLVMVPLIAGSAAGATTLMTAGFGNIPAAHDGSAFTVSLRFNVEPTLSYVTLRDHAFGVTGGSVTGARRLAPGRDDRWNITVQPDAGNSGDVTVTLAPTEDCDAVSAICTADGAALSGHADFTVAGPQSAAGQGSATVGSAELTAQLSNAPADHDGSAFALSLTFSVEPELSYVTLRDSAFDVEGGSVHAVRRVIAGSNRRWTVTVVPTEGSDGDVALTLPATKACNATGAVCTARGDRLVSGDAVTVRGPHDSASGRVPRDTPGQTPTLGQKETSGNGIRQAETAPGAIRNLVLATYDIAIFVDWWGPVSWGSAANAEESGYWYEMEYRRMGDAAWTVFSPRLISGGTSEVPGYTPGAYLPMPSYASGDVYDVRVRAVILDADTNTAILTGPWTMESTRHVTRPWKVSSLALRVVDAGDPASIEATWSTAAYDGGAAVTGYRVWYRRTDGGDLQWLRYAGVRDSDLSRTETISGLESGVEYKVAVAATNPRGTGGVRIASIRIE